MVGAQPIVTEIRGEVNMYKVHVFLDNRKIIQQRMQHIPARGDIVRIGEDTYCLVTEITWCFDEESDEGQRVNLVLEIAERFDSSR